jgi:hypothetical protein
LAKAANHLFGDNLPSGAEPHIKRLAALLDETRAETLRPALAERDRLRASLDAATTLQFWGAGGRRGDYVLVCFDDEEDELPWQLQVFTCERSSMFGEDVIAFKTQDEATSEALRLAATLTKRPAQATALPGSGGLVPREEHRRGPRRRP